MKGLFLNNIKAKDSIHESGLMVYECLKLSALFQLDYIEIGQDQRSVKAGYDFYFFNYHPLTMPWLDTKLLRESLGTVITIILEVSPGDAFVMMPEKDFNIYCALDPTVTSKGNLYAFPRPLEKSKFEASARVHEVPVIGSFGFATPGKGFEHVIEAVNKEFDAAVVRINIPFGDFVPDSKSYSEQLSDNCKRLAKPGIRVEITHDFFAKEDLIAWCAENDLNCFLYDRDLPGLAATTDQAIITGKPLSVSRNPTFRHITAYLPPYPEFSLWDSLAKSAPFVTRMKDDWSQEKFLARFEEILQLNRIVAKSHSTDKSLLLSIKGKTSLPEKLYSRIKKYKRKIKKVFFPG